MSQLFSLYTELTVNRTSIFTRGCFTYPAIDRLDGLTSSPANSALTHISIKRCLHFHLAYARDFRSAVAIVHEPELLILDEPTSGVDPLARDQFWEL